MRNPMTVEALAAWLEKKPRGGSYVYTNGSMCLLHEYFTEVGLPIHRMGAITWCDTRMHMHDLPKHFNAIAKPAGGGNFSTYGHALKRAEKILQKEMT